MPVCPWSKHLCYTIHISLLHTSFHILTNKCFWNSMRIVSFTERCRSPNQGLSRILLRQRANGFWRIGWIWRRGQSCRVKERMKYRIPTRRLLGSLYSPTKKSSVNEICGDCGNGWNLGNCSDLRHCPHSAEFKVIHSFRWCSEHTNNSVTVMSQYCYTCNTLIIHHYQRRHWRTDSTANGWNFCEQRTIKSLWERCRISSGGWNQIYRSMNSHTLR